MADRRFKCLAKYEGGKKKLTRFFCQLIFQKQKFSFQLSTQIFSIFYISSPLPKKNPFTQLVPQLIFQKKCRYTDCGLSLKLSWNKAEMDNCINVHVGQVAYHAPHSGNSNFSVSTC